MIGPISTGNRRNGRPRPMRHCVMPGRDHGRSGMACSSVEALIMARVRRSRWSQRVGRCRWWRWRGGQLILIHKRRMSHVRCRSSRQRVVMMVMVMMVIDRTETARIGGVRLGKHITTGTHGRARCGCTARTGTVRG